VAKQDLLDMINDASGESTGTTGGSATRACVRQPEAGGGLAGGAVVEMIIGAYPLMMTYLDEVTNPRIDLVQREKSYSWRFV
jgi:hypothetical protein